MKPDSKPPGTIDEYIDMFPKDIQSILQQVRATIHAAAPEASEKISYGIPTFFLNGNLVHFAAFKTHLGFYPGPSGIAAFLPELSGYAISKGTVRFPLDSPMPLKLVGRITEFRIQENRLRTSTRADRHQSE